MIMIKKNNSGQVLIESILIIIILFVAFVYVSRAFTSEGYLAQLVEGPWKHLDGMIQNGVWETAENSYNSHPNHSRRHISIIGDEDL